MFRHTVLTIGNEPIRRLSDDTGDELKK